MGSKTWDRIQGSWLTRLRISFTQQTLDAASPTRAWRTESGRSSFPHDSIEALTRWRFVSNGQNPVYSSNDECSNVLTRTDKQAGYVAACSHPAIASAALKLTLAASSRGRPFEVAPSGRPWCGDTPTRQLEGRASRSADVLRGSRIAKSAWPRGHVAHGVGSWMFVAAGRRGAPARTCARCSGIVDSTSVI